jgi:hypothetical protein
MLCVAGSIKASTRCGGSFPGADSGKGKRLVIGNGAETEVNAGLVDLPRVVAIIRPDQMEPTEMIADFGNEGRPITILNTRGVNDDPYRRPFSIDERMDLAPFHLLAGIVAYLAIKTTPFSADFKLWLSTTAAVGLASRPSFSRNVICNSSQIASQTPSF